MLTQSELISEHILHIEQVDGVVATCMQTPIVTVLELQFVKKSLFLHLSGFNYIKHPAPDKCPVSN